VSLFDDAAEERRAAHAPLADRLRPHALDEFAGQPQLVGEGAALRRAIDGGILAQLIETGVSRRFESEENIEFCSERFPRLNE